MLLGEGNLQRHHRRGVNRSFPTPALTGSGKHPAISLKDKQKTPDKGYDLSPLSHAAGTPSLKTAQV
jgi:hypothetical protein